MLKINISQYTCTITSAGKWPGTITFTDEVKICSTNDIHIKVKYNSYEAK
uniref:Uncharacterized protein n=1 Tax=Arundo donax TaxID=35708 RepID=A0A0A9EMU3_ARUDO